MQTTISHALMEPFPQLSEAAFPQAEAASEHSHGNPTLAVHALPVFAATGKMRFVLGLNVQTLVCWIVTSMVLSCLCAHRIICDLSILLADVSILKCKLYCSLHISKA